MFLHGANLLLISSTNREYRKLNIFFFFVFATKAKCFGLGVEIVKIDETIVLHLGLKIVVNNTECFQKSA